MTTWTATVEYPAAVTQDQAETITSRGDFPIVRIDGGERTAVSFGVDAPTLRQAVDATLRQARDLVAGILAVAPDAARVLTDDRVTAELERPRLPDLVDSPGAREILGGISQQRLSELAHTRDDFPEPLQVFAGGRAIYARAAVEGFRDRWERKSGRPRKVV